MREYMRKLMLAGLVLIMVFAFAGCNGSGDEKATETTADTQATEETAETETTADAADGYDIMEGSSLKDGGEQLLLYGNDFLLVMPNDDDWGYEQTSPTSLEIYFQDAREDGYGGNLVTIMAFDPDDTSYEEFPDYVIAGTGQNVNKTFIALFPTDVQYDPADADQEEDYNELLAYVRTISEGSADSPFQTRDSD